MKELYGLVQSLSRSEVRTIKASLTGFSKRNTTGTKTSELFEYLLKAKAAPGNKECSEKIYRKAGDVRFKMLKSRLKAKILDTLSFDLNVDRRGVFDPVDHKTIKIRKKLSQLLLLSFSRGNQIVVNRLLKEIIATSKKYESFVPLIEALKFKKYVIAAIKGKKDFDEVTAEIDFYEKCNRAVNTAMDFYYRIYMRTDFSGHATEADLQQYLKQSINILTEEYNSTNSALVGYYLKFIGIAYHESKEDYALARQTCLELLSLIMNSPAIYRKQRIGIVNVNLCRFNIYLNEYERAISYAREAQNYFVKSHSNFIRAKEHEFYAQFYSGQLEEAELIVKELIKRKPSEGVGDFHHAKYRFYYAYVEFKKKNYKEALRELSKRFDIQKDKEGWDRSIRLLTIMAFIELERFDEASLRINSLQKHIHRGGEKNEKMEDRKRDGIIMNILLALDKCGFAYEFLKEKTFKEMALLEGDHKNYRWDPFSSELIPFHKWIREKCGKVSARKKKLTDEVVV